MDDGFDRFIGATPDPNNWTSAACQWTRYQYLCPQETGAGFACGTIIPNSVNFKCQTGYTPTADGHCRQNPKVERPCACPENGKVNPTVGHPIVLSTGAKVLGALDYESGDGQFRIGREYRSFQVGRPIDTTILPRSNARGLAAGWNFDFGYEIQLGTFSGSPSSPTAKVAILTPDGSGYSFVLQSSGLWIADPAFGAANAPTNLKLEFVGTLPANLADIKTASNSWKLTDGGDSVWTLQTRIGPNGGNYITGWPTQKVARDGYTWTFAYNTDSSLATINDSFGRAATFDWHKFYITSLATPPAGSLPYPTAVKTITLPDSTSLRYSYDPPPATSAPSNSFIERLTKVERLSAVSALLDSVSYLYEDARFPRHVTGVIDNRNIRVRTYAYDAKGRATSTQVAEGVDAQTVQFGTSGTSQTRRVVGPLGKADNYTFAQFSGGLADYRLTQIAGEASPSTPASTSSLGYGTDTFIGSATDAENRQSTTTRDARGRPLNIVEGVGTPSQRSTTITWHATFNVPLTIVRQGLTETRGYNATGQLTSVTLTDTTGQTVPYSTGGQTRTTTYTWSAAGRLQLVNGPLAASGPNDDLTTYAYTAQGNLQTVTNALGQITTFVGHDGNGRPTTVTDPNGIVTALTYDGMGRVATLTAKHPTDTAQDAVTSFGYDAIGQLTSLTLPSTETLAMDYDAAGRLTAMRAANGERRDFAYDAMGNVTEETDQRADTTIARRITRAFDELGRIVRQTSGPGQTPARWAYDKVGNPVAVTSPNGHATTAAFDPLDRVVSTLAPDSGSTVLAYDPQDNLTAHTDPKAVTTQFTYNGFGEVIQEVSPDRGTSTYWYDAAGQLSQSSDGRGQVIAYTHDWLGRVTSKTPQGQPASEAVTYTWDSGGLPGSYAIGRLGKVDDGTGTTLFLYDHRGNLTAKQQAIGTSGAAQLAYTYDLADRIVQIAYPSGRQVAYGYDAKGRVSSVQTRASGVSTWTTVSSAYTYEPFGAVKAMALGNGLAVAILRQAQDDRIASRRLYRTADDTSLSWLAYGYDADGNIGAITNQLAAAGSARHKFAGGQA